MYSQVDVLTECRDFLGSFMETLFLFCLFCFIFILIFLLFFLFRCILVMYYNNIYCCCRSLVLATCAPKPKVLASILAAIYVQRWALCSNRSANLYVSIKRVRGGSRAAATWKMECFVIILNGFQPLTIITKHSILDAAAALDPPLRVAVIVRS